MLTRPAASLLAAILLGGCGSSLPPPVEPSPELEAAPTPKAAADTEKAAPEAEKPARAGQCKTKDACLAQARKADEAKDKERAATLYARACELGSGAGCNGVAFGLPDDEKDRKVELSIRACHLGHDGLGMAEDGVGCMNAAESIRAKDPKQALELYTSACNQGWVMACERGSRHAYSEDEPARAAELAAKVCNDDKTSGCGILGVLYINGRGVPRDLDKAAKLLAQACKGGDEEACENAKKLGAMTASSGLDVEDANISMGEVTADGMTMRDVACKSEGGGLGALMLGPVVAGVVASKRAQLRACSPKGGEPRVRFAMAGGRVTKAEAKADTPAVEACVVKVLKTMAGPMDATCAATLVLGK